MAPRARARLASKDGASPRSGSDAGRAVGATAERGHECRAEAYVQDNVSAGRRKIIKAIVQARQGAGRVRLPPPPDSGGHEARPERRDAPHVARASPWERGGVGQRGGASAGPAQRPEFFERKRDVPAAPRPAARSPRVPARGGGARLVRVVSSTSSRRAGGRRSYSPCISCRLRSSAWSVTRSSPSRARPSSGSVEDSSTASPSPMYPCSTRRTFSCAHRNARGRVTLSPFLSPPAPAPNDNGSSGEASARRSAPRCRLGQARAGPHLEGRAHEVGPVGSEGVAPLLDRHVSVGQPCDHAVEPREVRRHLAHPLHCCARARA